MNEQELFKLSADDRAEHLKKLTPNFDELVVKAMDNVYQTDDEGKRSRVLRAFGMRVEDHLSVPGATFGGHALDHLPQGNTSTSISQRDYEMLNATACGVAGLVYKRAGYEEASKPAFAKYGERFLEAMLG